MQTLTQRAVLPPQQVMQQQRCVRAALPHMAAPTSQARRRVLHAVRLLSCSPCG